MADDTVKKQLEADRKIVDESNRQFVEMSKGKPTPTQEENDRAILGEHVDKKEDDGSGPEPKITLQRVVEAKPGQQAGYQTRQTSPKPAGT
jgi:hypothetical protein